MLGINDDPVTIKAVELTIIDRAFAEGWVEPAPPALETGKRVAVVGSGPAGLAAAQQLRRGGHAVTVFERADRIGGLLRYGIPEFKMEKRVLDRRLRQLEREGVQFRVNAHVGHNVSAEELRREFDAILLAGRAPLVICRSLGAILKEFISRWSISLNKTAAAKGMSWPMLSSSPRTLSASSSSAAATPAPTAWALSTAKAQPRCTNSNSVQTPGAARRRQSLATWPNVYRVSSAHEEGGERVYSVSTKRFHGNARDNVKALELVQVEIEQVNGRPSFKEIAGSGFELPCDLVLLAMGFTGPEKPGCWSSSGCSSPSGAMSGATRTG